jgi:hypothetical protein
LAMDLIVTYIYALNSKDALAFTISEIPMAYSLPRMCQLLLNNAFSHFWSSL